MNTEYVTLTGKFINTRCAKIDYIKIFKSKLYQFYNDKETSYLTCINLAR